MKALKNEKGFTLIEIVLVLGAVGMLLVLLSTNYLSVYKTYLRVSQKADNLEEARLVMNFITDNFRKYEAGYCEVQIGDLGTKLEDQEEGTVKKIIFRKEKRGIDSDRITYHEKQVIFEGNEIASHIESFNVKRNGQLYDFLITVKREGNKAMPEQVITIGTTVNMQYMQN